MAINETGNNGEQFTPGNINAGDASASLYKNDAADDKQEEELHPGQNVDDLREAMHGDPDLDPDLEDEDLAEEDFEDEEEEDFEDDDEEV